MADGFGLKAGGAFWHCLCPIGTGECAIEARLGGADSTDSSGDRSMANEGYHEPIDELSDETRDMHRAIISLMEELEAVDWYNQRVDACKDDDLRAILAHNRDEEKEHAAMVLEWIRRKDPKFDDELKDYLFTSKPIAHK
jgi:ferritin-like protein